MTERIDFALEPGVILFAVLFFVLVNVLLAAVLYPYFRDKNAVEEDSSTAISEEPGERMGEPVSDREPLEERVDEFLEEIHREREQA